MRTQGGFPSARLMSKCSVVSLARLDVVVSCYY